MSSTPIQTAGSSALGKHPASFELGGKPGAVLHATTRRVGAAVIVSVAGEADASNEHAFAQMLNVTAATVGAPGPFVVDVRQLDFMGCCAVNADFHAGDSTQLFS